MRKKILFILVCMFLLSPLYSWRNYSIFPFGADENGIGRAGAADAASETAAVINPAGLSQDIYSGTNDYWTFAYEVYSGVRIIDPLQWDIKLDFDTFPFIAVSHYNSNFTYSIALASLFRSPDENSPLAVRTLQGVASFQIMPELTAGLGIGPVLASEDQGYGFSWTWQAGLLWKPAEKIQFGLHFRSPFDLTWSAPPIGTALYESFPFSAEAGFAWRASEYLDCFGELDWTGIDGIRYVLNNKDYSPSFGDSLLSRLHPHAGIRFLEMNTGAHISLGVMQDSYYYQTGAVDQYLLTAGVRAYGQNLIFRASVIDGLLIGLFYPGNVREEKLSVSFGFKI